MPGITVIRPLPIRNGSVTFSVAGCTFAEITAPSIVWIPAEMKVFATRYAKAADEHPQTLEKKLRGEDWGSWVDWARPAPGHRAAPSWLDKDGFSPFAGIGDIDFGIRSH